MKQLAPRKELRKKKNGVFLQLEETIINWTRQKALFFFFLNSFVGVKVLETEESYISQSSFMDNDELPNVGLKMLGATHLKSYHSFVNGFKISMNLPTFQSTFGKSMVS